MKKQDGQAIYVHLFQHRLVWMKRPSREWHSLWHFTQVKGVAGLSAWSCVFLPDLFFAACCVRFSSKRERPFFTSCFQVVLSAVAASQVLVLMPIALRSRLQMSLLSVSGRSLPSPAHLREGPWGCVNLPCGRQHASLFEEGEYDQDACYFEHRTVCHLVLSTRCQGYVLSSAHESC